MGTPAVAADDEIVVEPLTRELYDALVGTGKLDGVPVELLNGELVRMAPQGWSHHNTTSRLGRLLDRALLAVHGDIYLVDQEKPFAAGTLHEPEPDIAVLDLDQIRHGTDHPSTAHLIVEVSQSSRRIDLVRKAPIYAGAGVPLYWVVDVIAREVIVHSSPATTPNPHYEVVETVQANGALDVLGVSVEISAFMP